MFYHSFNYGGILQAYSLTQYLIRHGIETEQIRYNHFTAYSLKKRIKLYVMRHMPIMHFEYYVIRKKINTRKKIVIRAAEEMVPHSNKVYTEKTIDLCAKNYTAFITGSDQVWHGEWPAYFLSFVPSDKTKIAYAASTGKSALEYTEIEMICDNIKDFNAISVRERDTKETLAKELPNKKVELVVDPTLLLERKDWEKVTSTQLVKEKYLFCYFLGDDKRMRSIANEYGRKYGLKVVTIPHMQGKVVESDMNFGDIQSFDAIPQDFLSYIKYADIVFTDSFHATIFSHIFSTQYVVFSRVAHKDMNNRLETLMDIFATRHRFIVEDRQFNLDFIETLKPIDYSIISDELELLKKKSVNFLMRSLE